MSVPRNFKLLEEYDASIGKVGKTYITGKHAGMINYGLADEDDIMLRTWSGMIIGIQGKQTGEFLYEFTAEVSDKYPQEPPIVYFKRPKIAMKCVGADGRVDIAKIEPKFNWSPEKNIADVLMAIRENMHSNDVNKNSANLGNTSY